MEWVGLEGTLRLLQFQPMPMAGTPSTIAAPKQTPQDLSSCRTPPPNPMQHPRNTSIPALCGGKASPCEPGKQRKALTQGEMKNQERGHEELRHPTFRCRPPVLGTAARECLQASQRRQEMTLPRAGPSSPTLGSRLGCSLPSGAMPGWAAVVPYGPGGARCSGQGRFSLRKELSNG